MFIGRKKPYTSLGIVRMKCARCRKKARYQWNCCANNNNQVPMCPQCDLEINRLVMLFFRHPHADELLEIYKKEVQEANPDLIIE